MYIIGEVAGNPVMRDESIQNKGVKERYSNDVLIKLIETSEEYISARDEHVNTILKIVTWESSRSVSNITYNIRLVRTFTIRYQSGYNRKEGNWIGSVKIEENRFHTHFEVEFVGYYKGLQNFYNETLSPYSDYKYFPTCDDEKDMLEKRVDKMIYEVRDNIIPRYFDHVNSEIDKLRYTKEQCCRMFSI